MYSGKFRCNQNLKFSEALINIRAIVIAVPL